jgi:hypothetical protein
VNDRTLKGLAVLDIYHAGSKIEIRKVIAEPEGLIVRRLNMYLSLRDVEFEYCDFGGDS